MASQISGLMVRFYVSLWTLKKKLITIIYIVHWGLMLRLPLFTTLLIIYCDCRCCLWCRFTLQCRGKRDGRKEGRQEGRQNGWQLQGATLTKPLCATLIHIYTI